MRHIKVVGAGLFGCIIARALRVEGHLVTHVDANLEGGGSNPAACLMKPSWFSSMGEDVYKPALSLLERLYDVKEIDFKTGPLSNKVKWIDPASILREREVATRESMYPGHIAADLDVDGFDFLVDATGIWANDHLPDYAQIPGLSPRQGVAFLFPNASIENPFIIPWAPYKQLVAFNRGDGLWVSDGTAVKKMTDDQYRNALHRCRIAITDKIVGTTEGMTALFGNRPYVKDAKPCYLKQHGKLVVANGGAKNGTIAAGWAASQILEMLK